MHATLPVNLLREGLQHYVRSAEWTEEVEVLDARCWTGEDVGLRKISQPSVGGGLEGLEEEMMQASVNNNNNNNSNNSASDGNGHRKNTGVFGVVPDLVVPFCTSIEIGILSNIESYKYQMMKQKVSEYNSISTTTTTTTTNYQLPTTN